MSKMYNVRNCNYDVENEEGELIRSVNNAKLDGYGNVITNNLRLQL